MIRVRNKVIKFSQHFPYLFRVRFYFLLHNLSQNSTNLFTKSTGFNNSRLPEFTTTESTVIKESYDFLGVNFYTTSIVYPDKQNISDISFYADSDLSTYQV